MRTHAKMFRDGDRKGWGWGGGGGEGGVGAGGGAMERPSMSLKVSL